MKLLKSSISIYISHIVAMLTALFLGFAFYDTAQERPFLFSSITTLIYIITMYTATWRIGRRDGRKIPGFMPDKMMPIRLSLIVTVVPLVLLIVSLVFPEIMPVDFPFARGEVDFFVDGCTVLGTPDMIYRLWFFHLAAFVPCGNIFAYIAELFLLPIIIFIGYFVGVSKFSLAEWLYSKIVFEGKTKDEIKK